jgi:hypothetical protein
MTRVSGTSCVGIPGRYAREKFDVGQVHWFHAPQPPQPMGGALIHLTEGMTHDR